MDVCASERVVGRLFNGKNIANNYSSLYLFMNVGSANSKTLHVTNLDYKLETPRNLPWPAHRTPQVPPRKDLYFERAYKTPTKCQSRVPENSYWYGFSEANQTSSKTRSNLQEIGCWSCVPSREPAGLQIDIHSCVHFFEERFV